MPRLEKEEKAGNEFRYVETEIGKKSKSRGGTGRRQETAPTSSEREERRVGLFDRQSRHWNTKVLAMVAIIVVVAAVIRVGHYSRRHRERSSDPREGHNQAKAVLRARPPSPLSRGCQLQHPPSRCNVFCRRVDDPKAHRSATRNTTGDDSFAECVDRRAIIPTIYLRPGGRQKTRSVPCIRDLGSAFFFHEEGDEDERSSGFETIDKDCFDMVLFPVRGRS